MTVKDTIGRRVLPRAIVALSTARAPGRAVAAARRAGGGRATVRLFVAFDDAYSAVAVLGLADRLADRRADLVVKAVASRGIPGDPAVQAKRDYAVLDAARLLRRDAAVLARSAPIAADDVAHLAAWTAALPSVAARAGFAADAMRALWLQSDGPLPTATLEAAWRASGGTGTPPATHGGVAAAEMAMRRRGLYDTPIALVHGQWFFAHERLEQIVHRLDELGWRAGA